MDPFKYCQQEAAQSGSSFYYSFLFLPPEQRRAITAVYAFCREIDDVVDECSDSQVAFAKLDWWQNEINALYKQQASHPITLALTEVLKQFDLKEELFHDMIAGMQYDLNFMPFENLAALEHYCYQVAGTVGLLSIEIFGYQDPATKEYAKELGLALQLINIIRDVGADAQKGRVYLPKDLLNEFNLGIDNVLASKNCEQLKALLKSLALRARQHYQQALNILPAVDRLQQSTGLIMANIYMALLDEIEKSDFAVLNQRIHLTPLRKFWIAWKTKRQEKQLSKTLSKQSV